MDEPLRQSILQNRFVNRLREEGQVDAEAYRALCEALRRLADAWRGERMIDKALAQDLYVLAPTTFTIAARFRESPRSPGGRGGRDGDRDRRAGARLPGRLSGRDPLHRAGSETCVNRCCNGGYIHWTETDLR
ncbi:hypothetical protein [Longimicrobium sp.]|uniref:hypothetical protein n=1 Tax=Longimicrobium sp. TaxID=2029185 RepID=UPI003B3BE11F